MGVCLVWITFFWHWWLNSKISNLLTNLEEPSLPQYPLVMSKKIFFTALLWGPRSPMGDKVKVYSELNDYLKIFFRSSKESNYFWIIFHQTWRWIHIWLFNRRRESNTNCFLDYTRSSWSENENGCKNIRLKLKTGTAKRSMQIVCQGQYEQYHSC